jgi:hypothetical protein
MPRKLTAAEHLQSYLADAAASKLEADARRRISYGDGLYLYITGPRSCRWRYDYRHRGVLTSAFWPAIGEMALGEKEAKAERSKLWLATARDNALTIRTADAHPLSAATRAPRHLAVPHGLPERLRQPRDVDGDPSRSSFVSIFARRASSSLSRE